ncbi:MAG TPA: RluA family pseudouridine synthase [Albitalea sp.]|nr:RluA family pseudouridine synthase [Albitalea sp.]
MTIPILFADDSLIVVDKPAGLLSVPGRGDDKGDCVATRVQALHPDARVVHRLDMATSGLMLMARGAAAQRLLGIAFARREVHKRYVAVVQGRLAADRGEIDLPLLADWPNRPRQKVDTVAGKASLTRYRVLADGGPAGTSRLELEPITGRSHQLRVHLLAIGHPIVGDALYGPGGGDRLLLHACELALLHPASGAPLRLHSEPPF